MGRNSTYKSQTSLFDEIIVDNFAGGGGASTGMELATGRTVAIAINHDPDAILMHKTNHPYTEHLQASVWDVDPEQVCRGRSVGLAWFSPDCKHFSKAKGSALVDKKIRGLAWIVLRWAAKVRPRVIILENVEEFVTWGPVRKGKPVKKKAGQTFHKWKSQLKALGYEVEYKELVAADYGAPTTRKRLVIVARCDGRPISWPEPTHAHRDHWKVKSGKLLPWVSAAEIIDWTIPSYSIFASLEELKEKYGINAVRPLAQNTMRRTIRGVDKYTIKSGSPFIIECNHKGDGHAFDLGEPVNTITGKYTGGVCEPVMSPFTFGNTTGSAGAPVAEPVHTVTTAGNQVLGAPIMAPFTFSNTGGSVGSPSCDPVHTIRTAGGQILASANLMSIGQTGGGDRIRDIREPSPTTVTKQEACIVAANMIQYHTEKTDAVRANDVSEPIPTIDTSNRYGLTAANLIEYYGNGQPLSVEKPLHTVVSHDREAIVSAHISKYFGGVVGEEITAPLPTVTTIDHNALTAAHVVKFKGTNLGQHPNDPLQTVTTSAGEFAACQVYLAKADGQDLMHWPKIRELLNKHCGYSLADDEVLLLRICGVYCFIADISLRMLTPRELYNAMGFPSDYVIDRDYKGNVYGKTKQVARCGNAVCPPMATAVVLANLPEWCEHKISTMADLEKEVAV